MGTRGRVPNRSGDQAYARNVNRADRPPVTKGLLREVEPWDPDPEWPESLQRIWNSMAKSGQSDFYQESDWAYAHFVFEEMAAYRAKAPMRKKNETTGKWEDVVDPETGEVQFYPHHKMSGQMFQAIMSALTSLMLTEGDRRRARIELESKPEESDAEVLAIADYQAVLGVVE